MALPVNIDELLQGTVVEWERLEFKEGWNPEDIIHSICAFANDLNNWGGGYLIVGVAEVQGRAQLPPVGLQVNQLDAIQKKLVELCHLLEPFYFPVIQPVLFQERHILIIWVPGGDNRPYKAPIALGERSQKTYYVRRGATSARANATEERRLVELAAKVPFDDRVNHHAQVEDLSLPLIQGFLQEVNSDLYGESTRLSLAEVGQQMRIVQGPSEYLKPLNIGLLLFSERPDRYFRGAAIDVVIYRDEHGADFVEKTFTGPLHVQLRQALEYLRTNVIGEDIRKVAGKAESDRFYNYPYQAVEEVLANAVYHRSYEHGSRIEVNVRLIQIEVLSFPGPLPPLDHITLLEQRRIIARDYRNRRIGDFLKELHLTEGRGTGLPTVYHHMEKNGSPAPRFETDQDRTYFLAILPIHPQARVEARVEARVSLTDVEKRILRISAQGPQSTSEIVRQLGYKSVPGNVKKALPHLVELGLLAYTIPGKPTSRLQQYALTRQGNDYLN